MDPEHLEELARERAWEGDYVAAVSLREQAFEALRATGETRRASVLAAYHLAFDYLALHGNAAVAEGWLERGIRLAEESGDCVETGWVSLARVLASTDEGERQACLDQATDVARRFGDTDLRFDAQAYRGLLLVERGEVAAGMRLLDEAATAARAGEVRSRVAVGEIFCKMLVACEMTFDVRRAEQWHEVTRPMADEPPVAWASAICRTHFGGILIAAGRWAEAERELDTSVRLYDGTYRSLRTAALVRLAELRVRQGRLEEAEALLAGQQQDTYAVRPQARVHLARGESELACTALHRHLGRAGAVIATVPERVLLAEAELGAGRLPSAAAIAEDLLALAAEVSVPSVGGHASYVAGLVAARAGDVAAATGHLESALTRFTEAGLPLERARTRLGIARLAAADRPEVARAEAETALADFRSLGADGDVDAGWALVRELGGRARTGPREAGLLSEREQEVLALLATGLSNPEIAARLFISRKTVAHHVSNVLTKLGLRNRAEAAAWCASLRSPRGSAPR